MADVFSPEAAVAAGFLDQAVDEAKLLDTARATAVALTQLDMPSHAATKLRARRETLQALREAIETDGAGFRARDAA